MTRNGWELDGVRGGGAKEIVIAGPPLACLGTLGFRNHTPERVRIKTLPLLGLELKTSRGAPVSEIRVSGRLEPHARARLTATLDLDASTPPGTYKGEIHLGERRDRVTIHVLEHASLHVSPERFYVEAKPGQTVTRLAMVHNHGNVAHTLPPVALVPFEDHEAVHAGLHKAVLAKAKHGHVEVMDALARNLAEAEVRPARVTFGGEIKGPIEPGTARLVEIQVRMPADLKKHRSYRCKVAFMNAVIMFNVLGVADAGTRGGRS